MGSSFHSDSAFLKIYSKSTGLFGHKKSENNNRTLKGKVLAKQLRTGVILAEDIVILKIKKSVHNRPYGTAILLTSCKLNNMCNAKNLLHPYGQRTKINYKASIAQYIEFVKPTNLYIVFCTGLQKNRESIRIYF